MEVGDSSDDDDFCPVVGARKRRKLGGVGADGSKLVENLLNNNKFGPLTDNNNIPGPAGSGGAPAVPEPGKPTGQRKQPPLVVKNISHRTLRTVMESCFAKPRYRLVSYGQQVICSTPLEFEVVQKHLQNKNVEFYTFQKRSEQPHRVVLRGLPLLKTERVKHLLQELHNLDALEVHAIKRKGESATTEETPYVVLFPKGYTNIKKLSEMRTMGTINIWWQAYKNKKPNVTQCKNCLLLGHGTRNCHLKARCNNCSGSHKTEECKLEESQAKQCANCSGAHEAMDRSCPRRAEFIRSRQQSSKPKPPATRKLANPSPPVPAFTPADFPPLPDAVSSKAEKKTPAEGGAGSSARAKKDEAATGSSQHNTGPRAGCTTKADEEEELYSPAELWRIFNEFSARLRNSRTRSDQVAVLGYMICKYGSK